MKRYGKDEGRETARRAFHAAIASGNSPGAAGLLAELERGWAHADARERHERLHIKDMKNGTSGWTVPWGIQKDSSGYWINSHYLLWPDGIGTSTVYVEKEDGVIYITPPSGQEFDERKSDWTDLKVEVKEA